LVLSYPTRILFSESKNYHRISRIVFKTTGGKARRNKASGDTPTAKKSATDLTVTADKKTSCKDENKTLNKSLQYQDILLFLWAHPISCSMIPRIFSGVKVAGA